MNKQYKVIWSKVKNSYVVVSELAKQHSKGGSTRSKVGQKIGVALAVMALSIGATGVVGAADNTAGRVVVWPWGQGHRLLMRLT